MLLPHYAGRIGNSIFSNPRSVANLQDLQNGYIVGQDNYTGETIASTGSITTKGRSDQDLQLGRSVNIVRPNSAQRARQTTFRFATTYTIFSRRTRATNSGVSSKNVRSCGSRSSEGGAFSPPLPPEEPPEIEDQIAPEEAIAEPDPLAPKVCQDPPPTVIRATPERDKYYKADSIDDPCPLGMIKAGFADLGGGEIYIQCKGRSFDEGVAEPVDPSTYGYDKSPCGNCIKTKGGKYATLAECQAQGEFPITYSCTPSGCVAVYDGSGNFATLAECQNSCSAVPYACIEGNCIQTIDGIYATLEECQASGCETPPISMNNQVKIQISSTLQGVEYACYNVLGRSNIAFASIITRQLTQICSDGVPTIHASMSSSPGSVVCSSTNFLTTFCPTGSTNSAALLGFNSDQGIFRLFIGTNRGTVTVTDISITPI